MPDDISDLLSNWPFSPGQPNVRIITGTDGEPRVQIRLDLGVLQMFADGRPDGQNPHGCESLLEYFEGVIEDSQEQPESERLKLSNEECQSLRDEAVQYYHRYMALLVIEDFDGVVRDTTRNLRVFDLCAEHAESQEDRESLQQYRPYVMMVRARAQASQAVKENEPKAAVIALDSGMDQIKHFFTTIGTPNAFDESQEVEMLRGIRDALAPKLPKSQRGELKDRLQKAIDDENYELAAILRDELKHLKD